MSPGERKAGTEPMGFVAAKIESREVTVAANRDVGAGYKMLALDAAGPSRAARPGQFLTLSFPGLTDPQQTAKRAPYQHNSDKIYLNH